MEFIIDFYKSLDTLNLIIFWGVIIVIILLLIFSCILINKNKKLNKLVEEKNKYEEEIPIKKEGQISVKNIKEIPIEEKEILKQTEEEQKTENIIKSIETEKRFVAEEHVIEYNNHQSITQNTKTEQEKNYENNQKMPTGPYQRNVLREMSLSQTSPIGITRPTNNENKKIEAVKDLEESLNQEQKIINNATLYNNYESKKTINNNIEDTIKKDLSKIDNLSKRKTEINKNSYYKDSKIEAQNNIKKETIKPIETENKDLLEIETPAKELLELEPQITNTKKTSSEKYLEEVSRKLSEAEIPDEIERTNYEIKQEEDAIISYKELMEKKDTIQTIDEEEVVISIEELMNRSKKTEEKNTNSTKIYKLDEEEENDNFIKELKQFRNDL